MRTTPFWNKARNIGKPNNLTVFGSSKLKGLNRIEQINKMNKTLYLCTLCAGLVAIRDPRDIG